MRTPLALTLLLSLTAPAWAQDADLASATPGDAVTADATNITMWTIGPVELVRFSDSDVVTVSLPKDAEVTLVLADGDRYRVRRGTDFGWVNADQLSQLPPMQELPSLQLTPPPL